jgi:hypothetical protein
MKPNLRPLTLALAIGLAALADAGCAEKDRIADTASPPIKEAPAAASDAVDVRWSEIKNLSHDERASFLLGFHRLQVRLDEQISELKSRRDAMKSDANTKDWDFAMKELINARSYLSGTGELAAKATPDSWAQDKERVGQAWVRSQNACAKVKASTTL